MSLDMTYTIEYVHLYDENGASSTLQVELQADLHRIVPM